MPAPSTSPKYDFSGLCALVVDDEPSMREIVKFVLKGMGFQIDTAEGGHEAFAKVGAKYYDLVVCDLRMPDGDGAEFLDNIYKNKCKVGVFYFLSAYSDVSREEVISKGAQDILSKPIDMNQFRGIIAQAVTASRGK
jgi:CheY-like chemotaxis protein